MGIRFEFDGDKFKRDIDRAVRKVANDALDDSSRKLQRACDVVAERYAGQEADTVFTALKAEIARQRVEIQIPNKNLRAYAEAISAGRRIRVQVEHA